MILRIINILIPASMLLIYLLELYNGISTHFKDYPFGVKWLPDYYLNSVTYLKSIYIEIAIWSVFFILSLIQFKFKKISKFLLIIILGYLLFTLIYAWVIL